MPAFVAALLGGLATVLASLIGRALIALFISYVTFKGFDVLIAWVLDNIKQDLGRLPSVSIQLLGIMQIDTCCSIILSALTARLVVMGMTVAGGITKMRFHK